MIAERFETPERDRRVAGNPVFGKCEVAEQPGPNRALVIPSVTLADAASVNWLVVALGRREGTEPVGRQQFASAYRDDPRLLSGIEGAVRQADREDLVRS
jgi:hypothetical protein